ncbi:hypothetical protein BMS3Abin04_01638 [bacterium BMS3Abin04]|nr:hypothetical protein BMS3Abin04_01638 [bacterium BMS3Abin04]
MRELIKIGELEFKYKKDILNFYKKILNSYDFGDIVSENDFRNLNYLFEYQADSKELIGSGIDYVRIAKSKFNLNCFEIVHTDNSTELFSYVKRINPPRKSFAKFNEACRQAIQKDLINVKQKYFDKFSVKGQVKCQETKELSKWDELNVDHRQPNTFSVILDRFIELNKINIDKIEYIKIDGGPNELADNELKRKFIEYHKQKANLRIVRKDKNLGRSHQARIKRQKKDLTI